MRLKLQRVVPTIILLIISTAAHIHAYESETTHKKINEYSGLQSTLDDMSKEELMFINGINESFKGIKIIEWIKYGGAMEDATWGLWSGTNYRYTRHFHDPLLSWNEAGLWNCDSFILWAMKTNEDPLSFKNEYSWPMARQYFYDALVGDDSENNYAELFRALGQLMHLVSDAAVPAHARNDLHPGFPFNYIFLNRRLIADPYERWASKNYDKEKQGIINYTGLTIDPAIFSRADLTDTPSNPITALWDQNVYLGNNPLVTLSGIGLAEYTNANFISENTMFDEYPHPHLSETNYNDFLLSPERVDAEDGVIDNRLYLKKIMGEPIDHFAAADYWYHHMYARNCLLNNNFVLDEKCYQDYAAKLIPQAVSYSTALLDYFFRGRILVRKPVVSRDQNLSITQISFLFKNATPPLVAGQTAEPFGSGTIEFVYSYAIPDVNNPGAMVQVSQLVDPCIYTVSGVEDPVNEDYIPVTVSLPTPVPVNAVDSSFTLVFRGKLGNEEGAVAAKVYNLNKSRIAYYAQPGGPPNPSGIYTASPDGSDPFEIAGPVEGLNYFQPAWSKDGTMMALVKQFCPDDSYSSDCGYDYNSVIVVIDLLSDQPYPANILHEFGQSDSKMFSPCFSPDGSRIVAVAQSPDEQSYLVIYDLTGNTPPRILDTGDNPELTRISASGLAWSPKGDKIIYGIDWYQDEIFGTYIHDGGLYMINPDGTGKTAFGNNGYIMQSPAWSPDGKWIVYASNRGGTFKIWRMDTNGENEQQIVNCWPGNCSEPTVSPEGMYIAFDSGGSIYSVRSDGNINTLRQIIDAGNGGDGAGNVDWSPFISPPLLEKAQAVPHTISPSESSTLSWQSIGATGVSISDVAQSQPVSGSIVVSPAATTTYTLKAKGPNGTDEKRVTVRVQQVP
jgi:Tol biopolymer transport system component